MIRLLLFALLVTFSYQQPQYENPLMKRAIEKAREYRFYNVHESVILTEVIYEYLEEINQKIQNIEKIQNNEINEIVEEPTSLFSSIKEFKFFY